MGFPSIFRDLKTSEISGCLGEVMEQTWEDKGNPWRPYYSGILPITIFE